MKRRILVVEDEPALRAYISITLSQHDYEVETAVDGRAAMMALENERFDLVVADIAMPRMDGLVLADWLKKKKPGVRCILVTAYTEKYVQEARKLGVSVLRKPFPGVELVEEVERLLSLGR